MTKALNIDVAFEYEHGFSPTVPAREGLGEELRQRSKKVAVATYDFSVDGGSQSSITLESALAIPADAVVTAVIADEQTALTSGGSATLVLKAGSTSLTGAIAFDSGFTGADSLALDSSASAIKVSAASTLVLTIGTADLTAGKVVFLVEYVQSNA